MLIIIFSDTILYHQEISGVCMFHSYVIFNFKYSLESSWLLCYMQFFFKYPAVCLFLSLLLTLLIFFFYFFLFPLDMTNPTKSNTKRSDTNINSYIVLHLLKLKKSANQNAFMISLSTFHTRFHYRECIISDIPMHAYRNAACQMCTSSALSNAICSLPGACITLTLKGFSLKE